jgi:anaerobic glycerol-3-phosphate dehydrogenase
MPIALYGLASFAFVFGGGMLGLFLGMVLPEQHRSNETQKIVQTSTGMVSLLTALVLGLLVAAAKNKYDTTNQQVEQFAASLMLLNRELVNYGTEAKDAKALLRKYTIAKTAETWPRGPGPEPGPDDPPA